MIMTIPLWLPPVLYWNSLQLSTGFTAAFTHAHSPLRPFAAATTAVLAYLLTQTIQTHFAGTRPSGPTVAMCWVNVLNAADLLVLSRASYNAQVNYTKTKYQKKDKHHIPSRIKYALILPYNLRRINTPHQISRLPLFSPRNPSYIPSRSTFLLLSVLKLTIAALTIHLLTLPPSNPHLASALNQLNISPSILYTPASLLQARFTLSFGLVTRAAIVAGYTSGAFFAVLLGSDPAEWPPIAASLSGAYSLNRLWGYVPLLNPLKLPIQELVLILILIWQTIMAPTPPPPFNRHVNIHRIPAWNKTDESRSTLGSCPSSVPRLRDHPRINGYRLRGADC